MPVIHLSLSGSEIFRRIGIYNRCASCWCVCVHGEKQGGLRDNNVRYFLHVFSYFFLFFLLPFPSASSSFFFSILFSFLLSLRLETI